MRFKAFREQLICNDAGLWEAIHASLNFDINVTVVDESGEVVFIDHFLRDDGSWESHVLVSSHWRAEIEFLYITNLVFFIWRGYRTVDDEFCRRGVGSWRADISRVVN